MGDCPTTPPPCCVVVVEVEVEVEVVVGALVRVVVRAVVVGLIVDVVDSISPVSVELDGKLDHAVGEQTRVTHSVCVVTIPRGFSVTTSTTVRPSLRERETGDDGKPIY